MTASGVNGTVATADIPVCLIQPPVVSKFLRSYHPAIAFLAGFLQADSIPVQQLNLNVKFAQFLLSDEVLDEIAEGGELAPAEPRSRLHCRGFAKILTQLFAPHPRRSGQERLLESPPRAYALLQEVADCYTTNLRIETLFGMATEYAHIIRITERLCEWLALDRRISSGCRLVGISVSMNIQLIPALILARWIRARRPGVRIVLGGPTISFMSQTGAEQMFRQVPEIDAAVRYDGEFPLRELVRQTLRGEWTPESLPGVLSLNDTGRLLERPPAPGPELERLPIPLYDEAILSESGRPGLAILQARGCYWGRCTYCDFKESYKGSPKYRTRRVAGFVSELEAQIERTGIRMFDILTDSLPPAFARRLARELIERRLQIHWQSFVMVDRHFTRELLSLMRAAGCHKLVLGLESMTDRVLALVKKQADQQENLRFLDDARATGIRLQVNLIPNLPTVTHGEAMKTLELLRNYTDVIVDLEVSPLEVTESSELGRRPADFHLEVRPAEAGTAQNHLEFIDPAMTPEERERVIADYRAFAREIGDLRQRS